MKTSSFYTPWSYDCGVFFCGMEKPAVEKRRKSLEKGFWLYYNKIVNKYEILQGRVKFPIGGKVRERFGAGFGEIPKPTV